MKYFNVDLDRDLWRRVKLNAALQNCTIDRYILNALEAALAAPNFNPSPKYDNSNVARKNIRVPEPLWQRALIAAARLDVSRRAFLTEALLASLGGKFDYRIGEEFITASPLVLAPDDTDYLFEVGAGKLTPEEIINIFVAGLRSGDPYLHSWLNNLLK